MSDLIDRQAAIDHWRSIIDATDECDRYNMGFDDGLEFCISDLSTMTSAEPERKTGRWIERDSNGAWQCDQCRKYCLIYKAHYCPNCGADMRG